MQLSWESLLQIISFFLLGALAAFPIFLLNLKFARKLHLIDWPKARGVAEEQTPIIGPTMVLIALSVMAFTERDRPWLIYCGVLIALMGYLDDKGKLSAFLKMMVQLTCVGLMLKFDGPLREAMVMPYGYWGAFWTTFFIIGLTNAVNFVDGIDGLAGVCLFIGALGYLLFCHVWWAAKPPLVLPSLLMGMIVPFLYFNVLKRKGFLGNIGSYFFAFTLGMHHLSLQIPATHSLTRVSLAGLCFLVPIADSILVISNRLLSLRSPFQADKGHLHHRLIQTALPLRYVLLHFALIELTALCVALVLAYHRPSLNTPLPFLLCLSHAALATVLIFLVEKASRRRIQYYFQHIDSGEPLYFIKYTLSNIDGTQLSARKSARIEALVSSEIRVTDLCFVESDVLFVSLRNAPRSSDRLQERVEAILRREQIQAARILEEGQFVKVQKRHLSPVDSAA